MHRRPRSRPHIGPSRRHCIRMRGPTMPRPPIASHASRWRTAGSPTSSAAATTTSGGHTGSPPSRRRIGPRRRRIRPDLRDRGTPTTATVVLEGTERRLEVTTAAGERVRAPEPLRTGTGDAAVGERVQIRYDPSRPTQVITTEDKLARDVTLWIVAGKLLVVGAFFVSWGVHRVRRLA